MDIYILTHKYKSEYIENINNYKFAGSNNIHYWNIYDYEISDNMLNVLYKYINKQNTLNNTLIIYDNCIINDWNKLNDILSKYVNVYGKFNDKMCFMKGNIQNYKNIDYIYNIDGIL